MLLTTLLATILLLPSITLAAPKPETPRHEVREASPASPGTWTPVYAYDLDPKSPKDLIIGYTGADSTPAPSTNAFNKRFLDVCHRSGSYVPVDQIVRGADSFCRSVKAVNIPLGNRYWQMKQYYQAADGTWKRFTNQNGYEVYVYYEVRIGLRHHFDENTCRSGFKSFTELCHGKKPDTAGGVLVYFDQVITLDPAEV